MKVSHPQEFRSQWRTTLSDYVTAIDWSPNGRFLAASSAAGEVHLVDAMQQEIPLQPGEGQSIDRLAFSPDGQFLAAAGQQGQVAIWRLSTERSTVVPERWTTLDSRALDSRALDSRALDNRSGLDNRSVWIDRLTWHPNRNHLAFSVGRFVQVWNAESQNIITTLQFEASSVQDFAWRSDGRFLAIAGYQGMQVWQATDWQAEPESFDIASVSVAIAWSPDCRYLASGNQDRTLLVYEWGNPYPWAMQGFPGKVRHLAWSEVPKGMGAGIGAPLLATASGSAVVIWERDRNEQIGWNSQVLANHEGMVQAIAFQPQSLLLASAAEDGWLVLWQCGTRVSQTFNDAPEGFSCLSWHPQGTYLAAGGRQGELLVWGRSSRGRGFGR